MRTPVVESYRCTWIENHSDAVGLKVRTPVVVVVVVVVVVPKSLMFQEADVSGLSRL